jgi:serine/threonine protein kinase
MTMRLAHSTTTPRGGGTACYQAPELLRGESHNHFGSAIYAFACVCYEVRQAALFFPHPIWI